MPTLIAIWENLGIPYEDWRESTLQWILAQRTTGQNINEIAAGLSSRWPGHVEEFYKWYVKRSLYQWDQFLKDYQPGKRGRRRGILQRGVLAIYQILYSRPERFGYWQGDGYGCTDPCWTIERIRDALHRYDGTIVSAKTVRRLMKKLNLYWDYEDGFGWCISKPNRRTPNAPDPSEWAQLVAALEQYEYLLVRNRINKTPPDPSLISKLFLDDSLENP